MHENPYEPPRSSLLPESNGQRIGGSLESGLAGQYHFTIPGVLEEAWQRVSGAKLPILLAVLLLVGVSLAGQILESILGHILPTSTLALLSVVISLGINFITAPMSAGLAMLGVRRAVDAPLDAASVLNYFDRMLPLFLVALATGVIILACFGIGAGVVAATKSPLGALICLPGIYFAITLQLAPLLVVEMGLTPMEALRASRQALSRQFWRVFGLFFVLWLVLTLFIMITVGVGVVWAIPMGVIAQGILYREVFGVEVGATIPAPARTPDSPGDGQMMA